jgi:tRNA-specific 2-thiouridylase
MDMREAFRAEVVEYFAREYSLGRTPNPCIKCNELLKFGLIREEALKLFGTDIIATGHYARVVCHSERSEESHASRCRRSFASAQDDKRFKLLKGLDPKKDQSYFLWTLTQEQLARTIFPLGEMTKGDVRRVAKEAGLKVAEKSESQEVCFIPDDDYAGFIHDFYPELARPAGEFVDKDGRVLGRHEGIHAYTIGQRRGLGLGFGRRKYVVGIDVANNRVILGDDSDLMKKEMIVEGVNWTSACHPETAEGERRISRMQLNSGDPSSAKRPLQDDILTVKIRYRHAGGKAKVVPLGGGRVRVIFEDAQRAITAGQAAVFYEGDEVLGGGWIVAAE